MSTSVGTTQEQLGHLFDAVAAADRVIAQAFAIRSAAIDEARRFSEAHAGEIPLSPRSHSCAPMFSATCSSTGSLPPGSARGYGPPFRSPFR